MTFTVNQAIEMVRALSEGEFDPELQRHFQGELGELASYLGAVSQSLVDRLLESLK
ncbi:MAG: hypothetical protein HYU31_19180 [Deltaproteobacteria bacterium]|nr:hypothetical protein [Deltaproteobacteria bacterium]MBI2364701.1 hypothetical protein [Deltaproteobacteria bacterium]MBI2534182.1 hypothetical protein [Deltaproteobacteria bacterium]MBI3067046.1 hypothetical protein [Deltaproteobacteria bacterium]